jgi:hypothetical protein
MKARESRPMGGAAKDLACGKVITDSTAPPTLMRALTLAIAELLQDMPGMGASESEWTAWTHRKVELLREIEAVSR